MKLELSRRVEDILNLLKEGSGDVRMFEVVQLIESLLRANASDRNELHAEMRRYKDQIAANMLAQRTTDRMIMRMVRRRRMRPRDRFYEKM